jgi:hypothetical protein
MISSYYEELARLNKDISFLKVGIEELKVVAQEAEVCATPAFYFYKKGKFIEQYIGGNKFRLDTLIKKYS